jgi:hypothetical protein
LNIDLLIRHKTLTKSQDFPTFYHQRSLKEIYLLSFEIFAS